MKKYTPAENIRAMSRDEVRSVDKWAIEEMGLPGIVLMENAGSSAAHLVFERTGGMKYLSVSIFCGTGNNGGDGFVVARHLFNTAVPVRVIICGDDSKIKGDARVNLDVIRKMSLCIETINPAARNIADLIIAKAAQSDLFVDALLGTGMQGDLKPEMIRLIDAINALNKPVIAIDIPSGLDCDTGRPLPTAIKATATVTFVALKEGFKNPAAQRYTGEIYIASIGIEPLR